MKLKEATGNLERRLAEEQAARLRAEESAQSEQRKSNKEIRMLRESLQKAREELNKNGGCAILWKHNWETTFNGVKTDEIIIIIIVVVVVMVYAVFSLQMRLIVPDAWNDMVPQCKCFQLCLRIFQVKQYYS